MDIIFLKHYIKKYSLAGPVLASVG